MPVVTAVTETVAPEATGTSALVAAFAVPPDQDQLAATPLLRATVAWVLVWAVMTIRAVSWEVSVIVTGIPVDPGVVGSARRPSVKVRTVWWAAASVTVIVTETVPVAGVVTAVRSVFAGVAVMPSTTIVVESGARPWSASTNIVAVSGSRAVAMPGSPMYSPVAERKWTRTLGLVPRLTTSASKSPVTPSWAPMPIQRLRTPALTAMPSMPLGATKRRASGRKKPCQSPGMARAPAGTPGPAVPERSRTAVRKAKPTQSLGPTRAYGGSIRMNS